MRRVRWLAQRAGIHPLGKARRRPGPSADITLHALNRKVKFTSRRPPAMRDIISSISIHDHMPESGWRHDDRRRKMTCNGYSQVSIGIQPCLERSPR
jgi:hypothetical protein